MGMHKAVPPIIHPKPTVNNDHLGNTETAKKMASSHFLKHLSCTLCSRLPTLSRRLLHPPSLTKFSALSFTDRYSKTQCRPSSILAPISTLSSSSSSPHTWPTVQDTYAADPYLSVHIHCQKDVVDTLSEALLSFGASSTSVDEEDDNQSSDEICINSIYAQCEDIDDCISRAADSVGLKEIPSYEIKVGDQCDWIQQTQESYRPVEVIEGLWIVPEWITPPDHQATNIILNPGLAFGTGEHPTTKLCILLLHGLIKGGELFLDYGTGSGILAIAALKFGAALSVGTDIDPLAIRSARQNAALNNIGPEKLQLHLVPSENILPSMDERRSAIVEERSTQGTDTIPDKGKFDVVVANILLNPLLDLADHIVSYAKPGAVVGLSGILSEQLPYITGRYSHFLEGISVSETDGWACVSGTKKRSLSGN